MADMMPGRWAARSTSELGDRAHVFAVWRPANGPLLKAFLSTVRFNPAVPAASPAASPGSS